MNVHVEYWSSLGVPREGLNDAALNIHVGTLLLKRIIDRTQQPTVETVATLYNDLGADRVSAYGRSVSVY